VIDLTRRLCVSASVLLLLITSCRQEPDPAYYSSQIQVDSTRVDSVSYRESRVRSTILNPYQLELTAGHCWSQESTPTIADSHSEFQMSSKEHTILDQIAGLEPGTVYQIRAYFRNQWDTVFGPSIIVVTKTVTKPVVITSEAAQVMASSALVGGVVNDDGGEEVTERGVFWGSSPNVLSTGSKLMIGSGIGPFFQEITNLALGTNYYVKAYATNSLGISYGDELSFTTLAIAPTVTTTPVTYTSPTTAEVGGSVTSDGGATVTEHGVYWGSNIDVISTGTKLIIGSGTGAFSQIITGLTPGTTYFLKAYATNSAGTGYGELLNFTTGAIAPTVTTTPVTNMTSITAVVGGIVTNSGGATVMERGVYWGASPNVLSTGTILSVGSGTGVFSLTIADLTPGTTYYFRAFATNSADTGFGDELSFTTRATAPTVATTPVTNKTSMTAVVGGGVINAGGANVTERGVFWGSSPTVVSNGAKLVIGSGTGTFSQTITGLTPGTVYFFKAYAVNSANMGYGEELNFTTDAAAPTVTTTPISSKTSTNAIVGGSVVNSGGDPVTERGVLWGASPNVMSNGTKLVIGSGMGTFSQTITGLTPETTYYIKAYAINSAGTGYGEEINFMTDLGQQTFTDIRDGRIYQKLKIGTQTWMAENLAYLPTVSPSSSGSENDKHYYVYGYQGTTVLAAKITGNFSTYGVLYNWPAAMNGATSSNSVPSLVQGICPDGWHLPSHTEWTVLTSYLSTSGFGFEGSGDDIGKSLASITGWASSSIRGAVGNNQLTNNSSGFMALPGGYRDSDGSFTDLGNRAYFWSTSAVEASYAWVRGLLYGYDGVLQNYYVKNCGFSIRCIKN